MASVNDVKHVSLREIIMAERSHGKEQENTPLEIAFKSIEEDNEMFLRRLRHRIDRVGIQMPKVEVRYENLSVEEDAYIGRGSKPNLLNDTLHSAEFILRFLRSPSSGKQKHQILKNVSGLIRPSRMTLVLGPPGAGKTALLKALAGKLDQNLRVSGKITYCGHELKEFSRERTCSYIGQHDFHQGEMTVRDTLQFAHRCLGVGTRRQLLEELSRLEHEAGINEDPQITAFMSAASDSVVTDYVLRMLGLEYCENTLVGDQMRRGLSGGEKKRLTIGEMLVGPASVFLMDEMSTGLDSSTTYSICNFLRQIVHVMDFTIAISLLQPQPETYELFDDVILLSDDQIIYQGPRESVLQFFEFMGFGCPNRKPVADFLQQVTSKKDQHQFWLRNDVMYEYVAVSDFVNGFNSFNVGQKLASVLSDSYDKSGCHAAALAKRTYGVSDWELFRACFLREWLLMKRNSFIFLFKIAQITVMAVVTFTVFFRTEMNAGSIADGTMFYGALFFSLINVLFNGIAEISLTVFRLPVFFKQRDLRMFPAWAFALPIWVLRVPLSFIESGLWVALTYYTVGFAPGFTRFIKQFIAFFGVHQMALALYCFIGAVGRTAVVANTLGTFVLLLFFILGGFVISKNDIHRWMIWGYYISPVSYGQNAIVINEFLDNRWNAPNPDARVNATTVGEALLKSRGFFTDEYMFWVCVGALIGFSFLYNVLFILALTFLNPFSETRVIPISSTDQINILDAEKNDEKGMVLPFQPLSLAFNHINYFIDMPSEMKRRGAQEERLQLLRDVSGAFRPGILTALVGVSGAGKTTLMDVLAGRKTGGYVEGTIAVSGYLKKQSTFTRVSGYCEQNDIHSPYVTVHESLLYSACLRLSDKIDERGRKLYVNEVIDLIELNSIKDAIVGLPGVNGLTTEQRKRLTIAVELVANPSIIFMDEPTTGLDARSAAIVMRAVRSIVDTGRTLVCTIHQPSTDIFEAFDELLLMKRGGQVIFAGPLGTHSCNLINHFEAIPMIPKIKQDRNPSTWMLEITSQSMESLIGINFAQIYSNSDLYQKSQQLISELSEPSQNTEDLHFSTPYARSYLSQFKASFWKQYWSYWRNSPYNAVRFFVTAFVGVMVGLIFWRQGKHTSEQQDVLNFLGSIYVSSIFLGATNAAAVLPVVDVERTVFYREKAAGMYSPLPYAFAQVAVEIIYVAIQVGIYWAIVFPMMGFEWKAANALSFFFFMFSCFLVMALYGMMAVALTPNHRLAAVVMSFFLSLWNLFSGFLVPRILIPRWWRWYYWACPMAWSIYGLVASQLGNKNSEVHVTGVGEVSMKFVLEEYLNFKYQFLPYVALVECGWVLLFLFVYAFAIKFLNFQRR